MASQVIIQINDLQEAVQIFTQLVIDDNQISLLYEGISLNLNSVSIFLACAGVKGMMQSLKHTLNRQEETRTITRYQKRFLCQVFNFPF
jgi:hypothetical protein